MTGSMGKNTAIHKIADAMRTKGNSFPTALRDIPGIPFKSFDELSASVQEGTVILQRFSTHFDNNTFELFASRIERNLNTFYIALAFLLPVFCIILTFTHSLWWLAGIPTIFWPLGKSKKIYNRVILSSALSSALSSELYFCFLYVARQVCLTTPDFKNSFYWNKS